jgi:hypothetical protein
MDNPRRVHCREHGDRLPTFVCRHLVRGTGLGFYEPTRPPFPSTSQTSDAPGARHVSKSASAKAAGMTSRRRSPV